MTEHAGEGPKASSRTWLGIALAAIASAAALVANLDTLQKWWCQHIGYSCTFQLSSETVRVTSGGGDADVCKTHTSTVCIRPSSPARQLVKGAKFAVTNKSSGVFIDGIPDDAHKS